MKIEVEITEDEIRGAVEQKIHEAVNNQSYNWRADEYIKDQVRKQWQSAVDAMIIDALNNSKSLREKIADELDRKIRAKLAAAMKAAG